jgi:hypothetical protein
MSYIKSICGIAKMVQIVMSIIAFLCSVVVPWAYIGGGWVNFVAITGFIHAIVFFCFHLLNFVPRMTVFVFIELISYIVFVVCFLIAGIVAAAGAQTRRNDGRSDYSSVGASSFFCFASMIAWAVDAVFQFLEVRKGTTSTTEPPTAASTAAGPNY